MPEAAIATARLLGEPLGPRHFAGLRAIHSDPRAMATLSADGTPLMEAETRAFIDREGEHWRRHGFGLWGFWERVSGGFAGYCGLRHAMVEGRDEIELAYAVRSELWNQGFATEMGEAALRAGFEQLRLDRIVAFTLPGNIGSRRVIEKLGFSYERDIVHAGLPHMLYGMSSVGAAAASR